MLVRASLGAQGKEPPADTRDAGPMGAMPPGAWTGLCPTQPSRMAHAVPGALISGRCHVSSIRDLLDVLFQAAPSPPQTNGTHILWAWTGRVECTCRVGSSHPFHGSSLKSLSQAPPSQRQIAFSPVFSQRCFRSLLPGRSALLPGSHPRSCILLRVNQA